MASPHVADDMMQPAGMLTKGLFPQYSSQSALDEFLSGLLATGYAKAAALETAAEKDGAALAWAYHGAYNSIYQRMLAAPSSMSVDGEASQQYLWSQIDGFKGLRDEYLTSFTSFFDAVTSGLDSKQSAPAVPNRFVW